jgi:hypothetical protein
LDSSAHEGHVGALLFRDRGDLVVVGGDDDAVEHARVTCRGDGIADHRPAGEGADVLARDALAAATGRDDREAHRSDPLANS